MVDEMSQYEVNVKWGMKRERKNHFYLLYQKLDSCLVLCRIAMKLGGMSLTLTQETRSSSLHFPLEAFLFNAFLLTSGHLVVDIHFYHGLANVLAHWLHLGSLSATP